MWFIELLCCGEIDVIHGSGFILHSFRMSHEPWACTCMVRVSVCNHNLSSEFIVFWRGEFQRRSQSRAESNICVDLCMGRMCLWPPSDGPLPVCSSPHTEILWTQSPPRGYRHFNNAWFIQARSIPTGLPGASKWSQGRKRWCNSTLQTTEWERQEEDVFCDSPQGKLHLRPHSTSLTSPPSSVNGSNGRNYKSALFSYSSCR